MNKKERIRFTQKLYNLKQTIDNIDRHVWAWFMNRELKERLIQELMSNLHLQAAVHGLKHLLVLVAKDLREHFDDDEIDTLERIFSKSSVSLSGIEHPYEEDLDFFIMELDFLGIAAEVSAGMIGNLFEHFLNSFTWTKTTWIANCDQMVGNIGLRAMQIAAQFEELQNIVEGLIDEIWYDYIIHLANSPTKPTSYLNELRRKRTKAEADCLHFRDEMTSLWSLLID